MQIERITVEGGFLDGLDLRLSPGLNVLIGGRGTGKTSVIELIRYCLDVPNYTEQSAKRSREHALAILQDGQVSLSLKTGDTQFVVSRSASSPPASLGRNARPIVFSQTDIESLGVQVDGRLRLIDSFRKQHADADQDDARLVAAVRSLTAEMQQLTKEIESIENQLIARPELEEQLKKIALEEQKIAAQSQTAKQRQSDLHKINEQLSSLSVVSEVFARAIQTLASFSERISNVVALPPSVERWPREAGQPDRLLPVRKALEDIIRRVTESSNQIQVTIQETRSMATQVSAEKTPLENRARELRKTIDNLQQGAGEISRAANDVRVKLAQLKALTSLKGEKGEQLKIVQTKRGRYLDELDEILERRFNDRLMVAERLNGELCPKIRVKPIRAAQLAAYASAVSVALRGSGLKYAELSNFVASRMSPRELVQIVEMGDANRLVDLGEISSDRALKLIAHLRDHGTADILTAPVEDDIKLELLDGKKYKSIENLSVGQRCTVVLPIIMEHRDRILVIDQPEDHLDNAFVVDTLLKAIVNRGHDAQLLLSTHNANIPVLGDASQVVVMGSDGRRGFVHLEGSLNNKEIVYSISTIMEGGAEAFARRAEFYKAHLPPNG